MLGFVPKFEHGDPQYEAGGGVAIHSPQLTIISVLETVIAGDEM